MLSDPYPEGMAVMTIRDLDDGVRDKLRVRAAHNKRSMESEVRAILTDAVESPVERGLAQALIDLGAGLREAGVQPETFLPAREPYQSEIDFE